MKPTIDKHAPNPDRCKCPSPEKVDLSAQVHEREAPCRDDPLARVSAFVLSAVH